MASRPCGASSSPRSERVLLTMADFRTNLADQVIRDARRHLGSGVLNAVIPRNVRLSEAPSYSQPIQLYDPKCIGARSYNALAREVSRHV